VLQDGTIKISTPHAFTIEAKAVFTDPDAPLQRVSGEVHTVPAPVEGKQISLFKLRHIPWANTGITLRGASVTIRALWVQPRSGTAYIYDKVTTPDNPFTRNINERWQAKSITVMLSTTKE